ncbi:DMT family transporter [Stagnihabitans tardus]|uniref:EamA family transporter n=1 Tax=Stagnihabitans tardus TaxID=2699202 RepID=A0AAE5BWH0_9RHOB|nr:DMT family transporter [Stagnihabitans tardus]NBZ89302.1 EamA family transporter [Stagnihabitans tardus]
MALSDNTRGILLMCGSMLGFTVNDGLMKAATEHMPLFQAIFLRGLIATFGIYVLARAQGVRQFLPQGRDRFWVLARTFGEIVSTATFLIALTQMPIANLSAILQSLPLAVTLAAAVFLREPIGWQRLAAILVGFVGVLIIIRPGAEDFSFWSVLGLISVAGVVLRDIATRKFSREMPSTVGAVWAAVAVMVMGGLVTAWQGWQPLALRPTLEVGAAGIFIIAGYLFAVRVMRVGELAVVAPFRYTSLLWAILIGWLVFGDLPDVQTSLGSGIVVASGVYIFMRERFARR